MVSLVNKKKYGAINAEDPMTLGYYMVKYLSEPYTLQEYNTTYGQVGKSVNLSVKA